MKVTPDKLVLIREMFYEDKTYEHIGKTIGITTTCVYQWVKKMDLSREVRKTLIRLPSLPYNSEHKRLELQKDCSHYHYITRCSHCAAILGSERQDNRPLQKVKISKLII